MSKMTQAQIDAEVVKGWRDAAIAAREDTMVPFYDRLLAALQHSRPLTNPYDVRQPIASPHADPVTLEAGSVPPGFLRAQQQRKEKP